MVNSRIVLLTSSEKPLLPYNDISTRMLFERLLIWTNGRMLARRFLTLNLKGRAEQQEVFRIFNSVVYWAHRFRVSLLVMLEFVAIQFTETDPYLG